MSGIRRLTVEEATPIVLANVDACSDDYYDGSGKLSESWVYLGNDVCVCGFNPLGDGVWEVHIASVAPGHGVRLLKKAIDIMLASGAKKIVGYPPVYNNQAILCGLYAGLKIEGIKEGSFMKNKKLHNQLKMGS